MALLVTEDCINCDVCQSLCPNGAISQAEGASLIDPVLCTECVGHFDAPQCVENCPSDCVIEDPDHRESTGTLLQKHQLIASFG
ncbi:YfhL family 4Fe-4S dicluster ferredoxin [Uliginosibacterium sp. 31-16]|uniref:YfhL family 4Fe-4S dicluster ferredoxin n=1 Tax=Uliginosibacterium sp. 31-16 TaxID=3068315 RepID=UPI00273FD473|nr:YfhL family 4Fe-4S dicluster ferredoxin [Uliginosibacterium sp. 31-16]MDP5240824.1 YfhL family 4Fe-4S dicluster ferredoxin [Uliginosibacterium sp. 31-16]